MKMIFKYLLILMLTFAISSCSYVKSDITKEMKIGLIAFEQKKIEFQAVLKNDTIKPKRHHKGEIIEKINNNVLTISYYTEEVGCPIFEGGYLMNKNILTLYYQDINFELVKCIDFFELKYEINIEDTKYEKINIVRLNPIKKGLIFK